MRTGNWRIAGIGMILLGVLASSACGGGAGPGGENESGPGGGNGSGSMTVTLMPQTALVPRNSTQQFTATVSGVAATAVTWTVDHVTNGNTTVGKVSGSGNSVLYTAPASNGSHVLVATSVADPSKCNSSTILVQDACAPDPSSDTVLNVKNAPYFAKGDGSTDDTRAIQKAVDAMAGGGGTVLIPSSTHPYLVDAVGGGILLKDNMTLRFESGATLKAKPNSAQNYNILKVSGASHVKIVGSGILLGGRDQHLELGGEWGHGLTISNSDHVVVENVTSRDCWGDGFYIGTNSTDVTLCNVVADNNRRAGLSITSGDGLTIRNSIFRNTNGTIGECGLNIEPNQGETVNHVQIQGCTFENNLGPGLAAGVPCSLTGSAAVSNIVINGNTLVNNGKGGLLGARSGIEISNCSSALVTGNTATSNAQDGINLGGACDQISMGANHSTVSGNTVTNNNRAGILEEYCDDNTITSNSGTGNERYGIHSSHCSNRHISGNGNELPVTYTN